MGTLGAFWPNNRLPLGARVTLFTPGAFWPLRSIGPIISLDSLGALIALGTC